jgi:ribosomal protein S18 acetylase RimI-like enzyme
VSVSPQQLILEPFEDRHAPTIIGWPQSVKESRWWAGPATTWPLDPSVMERWHADPDVHPYVLSERGAVIGYGELWVDAEEQEVELARLIVAPDRRGQGVGRRLVRLLLHEARDTGYPYAFLRVFPENRAGIACYLRSGFAQVSPADQQRFNQGQPVDYLWMRCALQPTDET